MISEQPEVLGPFQIRAIDAVVDQTLLNIPFGWSLDSVGHEVGGHLSDHQDPSLH